MTESLRQRKSKDLSIMHHRGVYVLRSPEGGRGQAVAPFLPLPAPYLRIMALRGSLMDGVPDPAAAEYSRFSLPVTILCHPSISFTSSPPLPHCIPPVEVENVTSGLGDLLPTG